MHIGYIANVLNRQNVNMSVDEFKGGKIVKIKIFIYKVEHDVYILILTLRISSLEPSKLRIILSLLNYYNNTN